MKFGETLHQRSVPQWSTYNFKYNQIKKLIKDRTSTGGAGPVSIPNGPASNRWVGLEDELIGILEEEYDNISLFLNSKHGEIERRLTFLEKQVRSARKSAEQPRASGALHARRFHKLLTDAELIGEDIQNLTRFASVQKTAFRKLLKKYRKWTGSGGLQVRVENEILTSRKLNLNYAQPLERLAIQTAVIKDQLQPSHSRQKSTDPTADSDNPMSSTTASIVANIANAAEEGPTELDAALATSSLGKSSGTATYWIHPDNLDEACALLLHYVREVHKSGSDIPRQDSSSSVTSTKYATSSPASRHADNHIVYFDNEERFVKDISTVSPSRIALSGRWCREADGVVTLSDLATEGPVLTKIGLKRKEIFRALDVGPRTQVHALKQPETSEGVQMINKYLTEHQDIRPLAQMRSTRSRYVGTSNSSQAGVWALLDSDIIFSPLGNQNSDLTNSEEESGQAFPHSVLEIRWEVFDKPEVVRVLDATHLAEKVQDFSLESAAITMVNKHSQPPEWKSRLHEDIRKVPLPTQTTSSLRGLNGRARTTTPVAGTSSGPSSDGPADSVFSTIHTMSSATSIPSPNTSTRNLSLLENATAPTSDLKGKKKTARFDAQSPPRRQTRYWNEFDDGDEDVNPQESYLIYVNPDDSFPGAKTVSKAFGAMYKSIGGAASRASSIFSLKSQPPVKKQKRSERSRLLASSHSNSSEADSSDSDSTPTEEHQSKFGTFPDSHGRARAGSTASLYRAHQVLTPRQVALEQTYFWFYIGLIVLSFVLLFVCGVLLSTGRKRAYLEVDIATISGIVAAEMCAILSMVLLWMRRMPLSIVHKAVVQLATVSLFIIGIGEIVALVNRPTP